MGFFTHHVFFCQNQRAAPEKCCANHDASAMREHCKKRVKELGLAGAGKVRVNQAGCLDRCEEGPVLVVYPDETWYTYVDKADIDEIIDEHLVHGRVVERLRISSAASTRREVLEGAAGAIEIAWTLPAAPRAVAVVAHPHPLFGGTMDNKVVTTLAKVFADEGAATFRFNFRGVGASEGKHDEGRGETADLLDVLAHASRAVGHLPVWLAGFSFGGAVALRASGRAAFEHLVLVAPGFRRITGHGLGEPPVPDDPGLGAPGRHTAANTIVVHGDRDETTLLADSLAWGAVRDVPVLVVPGADHFFHRKLHVLRDTIGRLVRPAGG